MKIDIFAKIFSALAGFSERLGWVKVITFFHHFLIAWIDGTQRRAWAIVIASLILSGLSIVFVYSTFNIDSSTNNMLSPELEFRKRQAEIHAAFPGHQDRLVIVIDGPTAGVTDDAALALTERLQKRPDLYGEVYDLAGEAFFRRNGLLYLDIEELEELVDRLAEAEPFLSALWHTPTLASLMDLLSDAIVEILTKKRVDQALPFDITRIFNALSEVAEKQIAGRPAYLSWHALMKGNETPGDRRRIIILEPPLNYTSLSPAAKTIQGVRAEAHNLGLTNENGLRVRLTGTVALDHEELMSVERSMGYMGVSALILVVCLLTWCFARLYIVVAVLLTLVVGLIWTSAFAFLTVSSLNLISVTFAVLFIGLSVDFGIHFSLRYREIRRQGETHDIALRLAASGVGKSLCLSAIAAAIAFYAFLPTSYLGMAQLGLIAGTGMFIALFANLTFLPALLTLMPPRIRKKNLRKSPKSRVLPARTILIGALVIGVSGIIIATQTKFDFDPLSLKDPETESVSTMLELITDPRIGAYDVTLLAPSLDAAEKIGNKLDAIPEVRLTHSLVNFIPEKQEDKRYIIEGLSLVLASMFLQEPTPATAQNNQPLTTAMTRLRTQLQNLIDNPAAERLAKALDTLQSKKNLADFERHVMSGLNGQLRNLRSSLEAQPVTLKSLPTSLVSRELTADGRARLRISPRDDVTQDQATMERFVNAVRTVTPKIAGTPVIILGASTAVLESFTTAGIFTITLITILMILLLRRIRDLVLILIPLALAGILTAAASVLIDQPFNFANLIVLPLLFGLGTSSGIHLVLREREAGTKLMATSTPRAVVFSALTTIASFGSIALSDHPGTSSMGILLTITIAITLISTMLVLPALATLWPKTS